MGVMAKQTGWSTEAQLLYEILKQLDQINKILGGGSTVTTTTTTP